MRLYLSFTARLLLAAALWSHLAHATPTRNAEFLKRAARIGEVANKKEFYVDFEGGTQPYRDFEVFVVLREVEDPLRKGWFDFEFVGRAAVAESATNRAHFVLYKPFKGGEIKEGDRLVETGDPLTADEMDLMRKEVLGVLRRDKELEDFYTGLISVKVGMYVGSLKSTSEIGGQAADTNYYKNADSFFLKTLGLRWWLFFEPSFGVNFDYASGTIPTVGFHHEAETSSQTYLSPGLLYRSRFIFIPAIYSITYFINKFSTTNPDDYLIGSTYSGVNASVTFYYPYRFQLFRLGPFTFAFNNIEGTLGYAPTVQVSDSNYSRGASASAHELSLGAGLEFNFSVRGWKFTNDLFFVLEGGWQSYDLQFSGATKGTLPSGDPLPSNVHNTETQSWYGLRIKYNFRDYIGELIYGL